MIMSLLKLISTPSRRAPVLHAADEAIGELDDMISRLRDGGRHPIRGVIADLVEHRNNVPYVTTVFEANEEMKSATQYGGG